MLLQLEEYRPSSPFVCATDHVKAPRFGRTQTVPTELGSIAQLSKPKGRGGRSTRIADVAGWR